MNISNGTDVDLAYRLYVLSTVQHVGSSFSFVGCIFVVLSYIYFKPLKRITFRLAAFLAVADIGQQIGTFMGQNSEGGLCMTQALVISYFTLATVFWPFCIALTLYLMVVRHVQNVERFEKYFHIVCWGMPAVMTALPFTTNPYGPAGILCWINLTNGGRYWQIFQVYLWVWLVMVVDGVLYFLIVREARRQARALGGGIMKPSRKRHSSELLRMAMYPMVLTLCYSFATADRVHDLFIPEPIFWLQAVHLFFVAIAGFLNSIAYATSPAVRRCVADRLRRLPCFRGSRDQRATIGSFDNDNDNDNAHEQEDEFDDPDADSSGKITSLQMQSLVNPLNPPNRHSAHFLKGIDV